MRLVGLSVSAAVLLAGLSGCGMGPSLTPAQMQKVQSFDVSQITTLGEAIHKGMNQDELLFYAPISIAQAKEDYESALASEDKEEKMASYLAAKKELANAYETKKLVKKYLSDLAEIDNKMKALDTQEIFTSRYNDFKDEYNDLIKTFDEGKVSDALEDKKEVMQNAKDLYGDAVVYRNINRAKTIMQKMSDDDLDEAVPKHYEKLEKLYEQTRLKIKREPDNKDMVKKVSKELNEFAQYTEVLAKDVVKLKAIDPDDYESYLDRIHHEFASLNSDEKIESILPLSIEEKISYIKEHKPQISAQRKPLEKEKEPQATEESATVITPAAAPVVEETMPESKQSAELKGNEAKAEEVKVEEAAAAAVAGKAPVEEAVEQAPEALGAEEVKQSEKAQNSEETTKQEEAVPAEKSEKPEAAVVSEETVKPEEVNSVEETPQQPEQTPEVTTESVKEPENVTQTEETVKSEVSNAVEEAAPVEEATVAETPALQESSSVTSVESTPSQEMPQNK